MRVMRALRFSPRSHKYQRGFTLIELSIVFIIVALVLGGILSGRHVLRAAEMRSILKDYEAYNSAIDKFFDKYNQLPGDMYDATSIWGDNSVRCADAAIPDGSPGTCNGNGDGRIQHNTDERWRIWQQLALSGLINGQYTGVSGSGSANHYVVDGPEKNSPDSTLNDAGWATHYLPDGIFATGDPFNWNISYGHVISIGGVGSVNWMQDAILTPSEAHSIDLKADDGKPGSGFIISQGGWHTGVPVPLSSCINAANNSDTTVDYLASEASVECTLLFINAY